MNGIADVLDLGAERAKAKEAVAAFGRTLTDKQRTSAQLASALAELRNARDRLDAHWPVLQAWTLLLVHPQAASEGEIYDMIRIAGFAPSGQSPMDQSPIDRIQLHLVTVVWPGLSRFVGNPSFEGIEGNWFDVWLQFRKQVQNDLRREDRLADCDALLELVARLFGLSTGNTQPASDAWVGALHEQAASYARRERCLDDPDRPLVTPSIDLADRALAHAFVASLGAVYSASLDNPGVPSAPIAAMLSAKPAFLRAQNGVLQLRDGSRIDGPRSSERRAEWIELLLGYWAAADAVVAELLAMRGIIKLNDRGNSAARPLTWADGHEQRIALIGPSGVGKSSLMLASADLRQVTIQHALGSIGEDKVTALKELWRKGEVKNTERESFIARTEVKSLCSFSFIDVNGESYFPQAPGRLQSLEVIKLRYARRPPAIVMLMLNGGRPREMVVGKQLNDAIGVIRDSPVNAGSAATEAADPESVWTDPPIDHNALNQSRPVYLLVSHVDHLIVNVLADCDTELAGGLEPSKVASDGLEAELAAKVLRLEDLHIDPRRIDKTAARAVLKLDRNLLASPAVLRVILDAMDIFFGPSQAFAAQGLSNIHLHFLRSGGGAPPKTTGVDTLWEHLWDVTRAASRDARKTALERRLAIRVEHELRDVVDGRVSVATLDGIELARPKRAEFRADAAQLRVDTMRPLVAKKFESPSLSLDKLLSDKSGSSIFSGRFTGEFQRLIGEYDTSIAKLDQRIGAVVKSVLELIGIPVSETFGTFSSGRLLIKQDENLEQLEKWRRQYLIDVPQRALPDDVADAGHLLDELPRGNGRAGGRALLEHLLHEYWSPTMESRDAARTGNMFHALRGALNDTCMWRNLPLRRPDGAEDEWTAAEKWIAENPALTMSEALNIEFGKPPKGDDNDKRASDWNEKIRPAIRLLAGFRPMLPTLHVNLLEIDQAKVRSVTDTLPRFDVTVRGVEALDDIRELAVIVRGGIPMDARLRFLATLATLEPLLESLNIASDKLAHDSENAVTRLETAQSELDRVDARWRSRPLFSFVKPDPTLLTGIKDDLGKVRSLLVDYGANGAQPVGGEAGASRAATRRAMRTVDFALWVARNIKQSPLQVELSNPDKDIADVFGSQIEAVQKAIEKCKDSLKRFYDTARNALLQERYHYLVEAGLLTGEPAIAGNLSGIFIRQDPGTELPVHSKEAHYKQAVATLLSRLEVT
ncbi:hypothetical protein [Bradyrhizobium elkanii]|uniref:hypothetical protein n=1 Tax=Bradyrhizobium elkanii TaxID=29448 RepID=UPI00351641BA